ncbi:MAG: two-component system, OmpR family, response regulator, partial [Pseudomonadota bacterium]|nr:two-component system, OmpR family, response regulator [Pseudomonadota bacterium]
MPALERQMNAPAPLTSPAAALAVPRHILVVDDDPALRGLLAEYLGEHDLRVTAVTSGREMFEVFDREAIDLVVLDLRLPGEDGLMLARALRERADVP